MTSSMKRKQLTNELRVGGLPDLPHAAFANEGGHVVVPEAGAGAEGHLTRCSLLTLLRAGSPQAQRHAVVPFVAGVFVERAIVPAHRELTGPRLGIQLVVLDRVLTRISDLAMVLYRQDKSPRLDFWGSDVRSHTTEGDTLWVNYKPRPFSSPSMAF